MSAAAKYSHNSHTRKKVETFSKRQHHIFQTQHHNCLHAATHEGEGFSCSACNRETLQYTDNAKVSLVELDITGYFCIITVYWDGYQVMMWPQRHIISCVPRHHRALYRCITLVKRCRGRRTTGWSSLGVCLVISWMFWEPRRHLSFSTRSSGCSFHPSQPDILLLSCEPVPWPQFLEAALMLS